MVKFFNGYFENIRISLGRVSAKEALGISNKTVNMADDSTPNRPTYFCMDTVTGYDCEIPALRAPDTNARAANYDNSKDGLDSNKDEIQTPVMSKNSDVLPDAVNKLLSQSLSTLNVSSPHLFPTIIMRNIARKWRTANYRKERDSIYEDVKFHYKNAVFVWCPLLDVQCDFIKGLLCKFGQVATYHDRWIPEDEHHLTVDSWGGVFAVYSSKSEAKKAASEIPKRHTILQTLEFSKLIRCFVKSELKHWTDDCSEISVLAEVDQDPEGRQDLELLFHMLGHVVSYESYEIHGRKAVIYDVQYRTATHAFTAATVLDGLPFSSGFLKADVRVRSKERAMLDDLPFQLKKFIGNDSFLFKGLR